jgi:UDPglucose 6-dehydrogenase
MRTPIRIAVVGSGYVGLVAAVCFAEIGHDVICVDNDQEKVNALQGGHCPIHEEWLPELLQRHRNMRVSFTTNLADATRDCEAIFIAVGTPQSDTGEADLSYVEAVANEIARSIKDYKVIVEKSTVPVYTNEWIRRVIERNGVDKSMFDVVSNPEFLREGTAVTDFLHPDRIVVGADSERAGSALREIYAPLISGSYYGIADAIPGNCKEQALPPLLITTTKSAEIIKHASNAFLALKISFINTVANLCEATDANIEEVALGMGLDSRIGPKFLRAGIGYGGSCFPKDVAAFRTVGEQLGLDFGLLEEVERINSNQKLRFVNKVRSALWTLRGKRIGVLGLAFKGGTDDIRESPAIEIVRMMIDEGCFVKAFDPAAIKRAEAVIPSGPRLKFEPDAYATAKGSDALLVLTDWPEFVDLDFQRIAEIMRYPIIVDGRNLFAPDKMLKHGITYLSIGRPAALVVRTPELVA